MGVGDALSGVFGGGNDYASSGRYVLPPTLGAPGSTPQQQYQNYQKQNASYGNAALPSNTLNFGQSNQVNGWQNNLGGDLQNRMGQNIDFGSQGSMGQQQGLINQILAQGQGQGPNPAMDQLRMTTDQNAMQGNALIASQRGVDPGLAARLASQNVAGANQQAAGQAALQSAQQQLGAQQLGGQLLGQQIGQQTNQAGLNAQNQQQYASLLANQLAQQRGQDIQQATAQGQAGLGLLAQRQGAQQNYQNLTNNAYNNMNNINAGVAAQNAQTSGAYGQGAMNGLSSAVQSGAMMLSHGGEVNPFVGHVAQKLAGGGTAQAYLGFQNENPMMNFMAPTIDAKTIGNSLSMNGDLKNKIMSAFSSQGGAMGDFGGASSLGSSLGGAGAVAMVSEGGKIQGKAKVDADSPKNDNVPALLSPGEVVIPRSALESAEDAHAFLDRIIKKNEGPSYKDIMRSKEKNHNMSHGGEMESCRMCNGGRM
jgi:pyruvate/2-oxoglutarate dehydrogenase complex dihydrolipoamide acyltransferase (E2) component